MEYDEYNDQDATDCSNGDYDTQEENEVAHDNEMDNNDYGTEHDGAVEDQLLDMMMEDRIGGTGYEFDGYED